VRPERVVAGAEYLEQQVAVERRQQLRAVAERGDGRLDREARPVERGRIEERSVLEVEDRAAFWTWREPVGRMRLWPGEGLVHGAGGRKEDSGRIELTEGVVRPVEEIHDHELTGVGGEAKPLDVRLHEEAVVDDLALRLAEMSGGVIGVPAEGGPL